MWNQINQFHEIDQIQFFAISKMAKKTFFELRKSLKLSKMQFRKNIFWFHVFFAYTFLNITDEVINEEEMMRYQKLIKKIYDLVQKIYDLSLKRA